MAKLVLNDVTNLNNQTSSQNTINENSRSIEDAIEGTLSRNGASPNSMSAVIDMNGYRIINNPAPTAPTHLIRKIELDAFIPDINSATANALGSIENARVGAVADVQAEGSAAISAIAADKAAAAASASAAATSATNASNSASSATSSASSANDSKNAASTSATNASNSAAAASTSASQAAASASSAATAVSNIGASVTQASDYATAAATSASAASGSAANAASSASAASTSATAASGSASAASGSASSAATSASNASGSASAASTSASNAATSALEAEAAKDEAILAIGDLNTAASNLTGGTGGQLLAKNSNANYDYTWVTIVGTGDMLSSVYDPTGKGTDAFSMTNMVEGTTNKIFTATERTKLSGIATGATANLGTVTSVAVAVPTGMTVSGGPITNTGTITLAYASGYQGYTTTEANKLSGIAAGAQVNTVTSVAGKTGAVTLAKGDVGLGNVDNIASATLLDRANHTGTQSVSTITGLGTSATLNTGTADGDVVVLGSGGLPAVSGASLTNLTKGQVGLGNVDNTSDANKPVSTATQTALNLKIDTSTIATGAEYRALTANKTITTSSISSAMAVVSLTDATTIAWNMGSGFDFQVTLGGNRTLGNPSATTVGKRGRIKVIQDGTGNRTLALGSNLKTAGGTGISLSTAANAVDYLDYDCVSSTEIRVTLSKDWK